MKVIIQGNWAPYVGTDYCAALGIYDSLEDRDCRGHAEDFAWERWEPADDEDGLDDEGPDYWVEEYNPLKHDMLRAGGGSFADDFARLEN